MLKNCLIQHDRYSWYTYRAVSVEVLGDHKVHSPVVCPFSGVDLTTILVKDLVRPSNALESSY